MRRPGAGPGSGIARGTQFRVRVTADQQASFAVTEGRVDVSNAASTVRITAGQTTNFAADEAPADPTFLVSGEGVVTAIAADSWTVAGQVFAVDGETAVIGDPQVTTLPNRPRGAMLRAYDKATGEQVGEVWMPAPQSGSPMTYMVEGEQYIVVAVSGGPYSGEYIAFKLPRDF